MSKYYLFVIKLFYSCEFVFFLVRCTRTPSRTSTYLYKVHIQDMNDFDFGNLPTFGIWQKCFLKTKY